MTIQETVDRILDMNTYGCEVQYPYVIFLQPPLQTPWTPEEVAEALDIDPALCCYNVNGNIRITCE